MDTWVWILVIVAAIVVDRRARGSRRGRARKVESRRSEAGVLRDRASVREEQASRAEQEAQSEAEEARRRQVLADQRADEARREREAAQATAQRADEVDPDVR